MALVAVTFTASPASGQFITVHGGPAYTAGVGGFKGGSFGRFDGLYGAGTPGSGGMMHDLGDPASERAFGHGINARGQDTESRDTPTGSHAFLYTGAPGAGGVVHDLGTLGGTHSSASAINDNGQILGSSYVGGNEAYRPFLYTGTPGVDGRMIDFDAWLDEVNPIEGAKWTLSSAHGLNNHGWIVGGGTYDDGPSGLSDVVRAFLLDASWLLAVREPSSLAHLTLAALALVRPGLVGSVLHNYSGRNLNRNIPKGD